MILRVCAFVLLGIMGAQIPVYAQDRLNHGAIIDENRLPVTNALLTVENSSGNVLRQATTDDRGNFAFAELPPGSYSLMIEAINFRSRRIIFAIPSEDDRHISIELTRPVIRDEITVTAFRGLVIETGSSPEIVSVTDGAELTSKPLATIGNALEGATGVMVQQSAYGQVSPFLRGLTGYHVLNLIDGVRLNNSTFRSGPNQYLAFIEPSQVQRIEALLGPAGSQYGSDSLGGAIQLISIPTNFNERPGLAVKGEVRTFAASADASIGLDAMLSMGTRRFGWVFGGDYRNHNDLRAGRGEDSRHVFRRFFGLSPGMIRDLTGLRQQDTGFASYGFFTKFLAKISSNQNLTVWYQGSRLEDVHGSKDLWGGLGRLRSDFEPQELNFFYGRYEKIRAGFLDSISGTFSVNSQSDGSIRQGLRATDRLIRDESLVNALGYAAQATTHIGSRQAIVFGGEIYDEHISASRDETDPLDGIPVIKRALYPNGSRYRTIGLYGQDAIEIVPGKLRANVGGRYTRIGFRTFAAGNRDPLGNDLGVIDSSQSFDDLTFNAGLAWQVNSSFALNAVTGRGFRAPNLNDLGALGLNDLGFEIPAVAASAAGGLIGTGDGENALSSGRPVSQLKAESLFNLEAGGSLRTERMYGRLQVFNADLSDPIVRRTMLFPAGSPPSMLAGIPVTPIAQTPGQAAQQVAAVATALDPRAVKAFINEGRARYYGVDAIFRYSFSFRLSAEGNYSYLVGRELNPNRFIRRLPPQQGFLAIRYNNGSKSWIEMSTSFSGAQRRLSGGDLTDERIGAARRRRDIADFFRGDLIKSYLLPGADGVSGTDDDLFAPTGETLSRISDRVLPTGSTISGVTIVDDNSRVPLYTATPGFASFNLRGGIGISERINLNLALMNILDKNYRVHGSGVDAPGRNLFVGLRFLF